MFPFVVKFHHQKNKPVIVFLIILTPQSLEYRVCRILRFTSLFYLLFLNIAFFCCLCISLLILHKHLFFPFHKMILEQIRTNLTLTTMFYVTKCQIFLNSILHNLEFSVCDFFAYFTLRRVNLTGNQC